MHNGEKKMGKGKKNPKLEHFMVTNGSCNSQKIFFAIERKLCAGRNRCYKLF